MEDSSRSCDSTSGLASTHIYLVLCFLALILLLSTPQNVLGFPARRDSNAYPRSPCS